MHEVFLDAEDEDGGIDHPRPQDLMFDPWLTSGPSLMPLAASHIGPVIQELASIGRYPRAELVDGIIAIVSALMANLAVLHRKRPEGSRLVIAMEHSKKSRYNRPGLRKLPEVVKVLEVIGIIHRHDHSFKKLRTTIQATGDFKHRLMAPDVSLADVIRADGEELIQLTTRPEVKRVAGKKQPKLLVDYKDTEETRRLRAEMEEVNQFLSGHAVTLEGEDTPPFRLVRRFALRRPNDPAAFNLHGRLYGGFWVTLKATERHRLRINGEPVADLDFASMFPRLAYAHLGLEPPDGDLYAIPGLEDHREGAKAAFSTLLSYDTEMKSLPSGVKKKLPKGWTANRMRQAFADHHPDLMPLFEQDIGLSLMFTESRILLAAMRELMRQGVPTLPMHDGMMVADTKWANAKAAMENAALKIVGRPLSVIIKKKGGR